MRVAHSYKLRLVYCVQMSESVLIRTCCYVIVVKLAGAAIRCLRIYLSHHHTGLANLPRYNVHKCVRP